MTSIRLAATPLFSRYVSTPLGQRLILPPGHARARGKAREQYDAAMVKWNESAWKFVVYGLLSFLSIFCCLLGDRFGVLADTRNYFEGCQGLPCAQPRDMSHRILYYLILGFYCHGIPSLLFFELRRKDFVAMLIHHVTTLSLIAWSLHVNLLRIGVCVMASHDVCDVFLEGAKMIKYQARWADSPTGRPGGRSRRWQ